METLSPPSPSRPSPSSPALPLYLWLTDVLSRSPTPPHLQYTPAHTSSATIPARANAFVDNLASSPPLPYSFLPSIPLPTFFMPDFMLHSSSLGYIDCSSIPTALPYLSSVSCLSDPFSRPNLTLFRALYDAHPLPPHPYTRASSAFSATVQLYARSSQLCTALTCCSRFRDVSPQCHFGCDALESAHHIFTLCPHFSTLRDDATAALVQDTSALLSSPPDTPPAFADAVLHTSRALFTDDRTVWPQYHSHYYLGTVPVVPPVVAPSGKQSLSLLHHRRLRSRIATLWHTASIHLAARIWGKYKRAFSSSSSHEAPRLSLPPHLSSLLP